MSISPARNLRFVLGEVRGSLIFIYASDPEKAEYVLIHEYVEWLLSQYLAACLMAKKGLFTRHFQSQKELIVDAIVRLIGKPSNPKPLPHVPHSCGVQTPESLAASFNNRKTNNVLTHWK
ncbi:MAG: hypothetical protein DRJ26_05200 [Candidatus Methanomethylicota archaeon]|uniref:Uncharacterized protein n=1 Tax=Thermoproteota archaeon TaxID=2056631 RepID=A0A497EXT0_9CREN|nr:MAG: hypothetical protein DRJ26_05200 [Candidatus Verstraetearchaeota archaeon]